MKLKACKLPLRESRGFDDDEQAAAQSVAGTAPSRASRKRKRKRAQSARRD